MADLVSAHFNEFIAAASVDAGADASADRANDLVPFAPNGVYRAADGWLAISVVDDEQFGRLTKVLGHEPLGDPAFAAADGRFTRRRALDALIEVATRRRDAPDLAAELRASGVPAEQVVGAAQLIESPHLASRQFFPLVDHDEWGRRHLVGIPWRPFGGPPLSLGPPPRLAAQVDPRPRPTGVAERDIPE
jgi:crotonobetainyl-CoA:carnitine CoA-transferase CaiB-like acyl-CoA transferase